MCVSQRLIAAGLLGLSVIGASPAAGADDRWYIGAGAGHAEVKGPEFEDGTAVKLFAGYNFYKGLAIEGAYMRVGDFASRELPGASVEVDGLEASVLGTLPLQGKLAFFGKVGVFHWRAEAKALGEFESERGTLLLFGAGIRYDSKPAVRGEWQHINVDDNDIDVFSIGLEFKRRRPGRTETAARSRGTLP